MDDSTLRLKKLKYAKDIGFSENFGNCDIYDEAINIERLEIMPESTICVDCLNER